MPEYFIRSEVSEESVTKAGLPFIIGSLLDDGRNSTQWRLRVGPGGIRLKVEQSQQGVGGGVVSLFWAELQGCERLDGFGEALFPGGGGYPWLRSSRWRSPVSFMGPVLAQGAGNLSGKVFREKD